MVTGQGYGHYHSDMPACDSCSAELQPDWKFCVFCGAPAVPGAIRPDEPAAPRLNILAIFSIVLAVILSPLAVVFGHLAVRQIGQTGEHGIGLARVAIAVGYVWLVLLALVVAWWLVSVL